VIPTVPYDRVTAVLLDDGAWREVANRSFGVDVVEARHDVIVRHTTACGDECRAGFAFATPEGVILAGPLTRLRAVRSNDGG
jgi:hypothetical protein